MEVRLTILRFSSRSLTAAAALVALSCGGDGTTPVSPVVTLPPAVAEPTPAPPPAASSCPLGMGEATATCTKGSSQLRDAVEAAIDRLVRERPELFNTEQESVTGTGQYRVLDGDAYLDGVVANLRAAGFCADRSLDRERVVVKSSNTFSEEWDIHTGQGFIRRGSAYQLTCEPAAFPVDPSDLISFVWVGMFSLECNAGVAPLPFEEKKIPLGCDAYVTATPKLLNRLDVPAWIHGSDVEWWVRDGAHLFTVDDDWRFGNEFNRILRPKGVGYISVCATVLEKTGCMNANIVP